MVSACPTANRLGISRGPAQTPPFAYRALVLRLRSRLRCYPGWNGSIRLQVQKRDMPRFSSVVGFMNPDKQKVAEAIIGHHSKGSAAYGRAISVSSGRGASPEAADLCDKDTFRTLHGERRGGRELQTAR